IFDLLPRQLKVVQGLRLYQQYFANARELLITVRGGTVEETENAARRVAESLRAHTELIENVTWQPPWLENPRQAAELLAYLWLNQPPHPLQELTNRLAVEKLPAILTSARERLAMTLSPDEIGLLGYDPFGLTQLPEEVAGAAPGFGPAQEGF